ncbi:MAG: flagellar biosynthetic protein FliO [Firmicutes bacterium]|nr:flagellar biosynthetic protein FliO [Bacillota bacterium]
MFQVIQALFFLALVAGLAYLASRLMGAGVVRMAQGRRIRLIEVVSLGARRHACIVSVGGRAFLLGVTEQCVSKIAEFAGDEAEALWAAESLEDGYSAGSPDFLSKLGSILKRPGEGRKG